MAPRWRLYKEMKNQPVCKKCLKNYEHRVGCGYSGSFQCPKCKHEIMVVWNESGLDAWSARVARNMKFMIMETVILYVARIGRYISNEISNKRGEEKSQALSWMQEGHPKGRVGWTHHEDKESENTWLIGEIFLYG